MTQSGRCHIVTAFCESFQCNQGAVPTGKGGVIRTLMRRSSLARAAICGASGESQDRVDATGN